MNHSITISDLLLGLGLILGLLILCFGGMATFAAGMSTNPEASREAERSGCRAGIIGLVLLAACGWRLFG